MRTGKSHTRTMEAGVRKSRKDEGFTLIEVLIAISIFAVGLLAVAAMQTSAIRVNSSAAQLTELNTWGIDKLEQLMGLPYTDPWLEAAGNPPNLDTAGNTHEDPQTAGGFTVSWQITDGDLTANTPVPGTKLITITVTGKGKTLRLVSVKSQSL
ncbi:MAG: prepilin-type N-terminal cleavage/methylation domain-containing protein [Thermodesulfobacteriota bacterium]|nr:prepilin-type N-terminal cleavage/methylation domain-containing protein [Thermodesulfobacteriota bacterium]